MPYGTSSCTYCACTAKVAFLSIFQFFLFNLHDLPQKKIARPYRKNKKIHFFNIIHTTYHKKKLHAFTAKKNYTTRRFFCTHLTFFTPWRCRCRFGGGMGWPSCAQRKCGGHPRDQLIPQPRLRSTRRHASAQLGVFPTIGVRARVRTRDLEVLRRASEAATLLPASVE